MNYEEIGKRIREYRKLKKLSQEQLAEKINISTTHMSHIETGSTKLSLQVLVDIAKVLNVNTDDLIFEQKPQILVNRINNILSECNEEQIEVITNIVEATKDALNKKQQSQKR